MSISAFFLVAAFLVFVIGAWSRWWANPTPYYPAFISAGLALWVLSQLWPLLNK
jgi:hypothetical protein